MHLCVFMNVHVECLLSFSPPDLLGICSVLMWMCLCRGGAQECRCLPKPKPEEGIEFLELELQAAVGSSAWVLGIKLETSARALSASNH